MQEGHLAAYGDPAKTERGQQLGSVHGVGEAVPDSFVTTAATGSTYVGAPAHARLDVQIEITTS